jgi:hypothetical protein
MEANFQDESIKPNLIMWLYSKRLMMYSLRFGKWSRFGQVLSQTLGI